MLSRESPPIPPRLGTRSRFVHGCYYPSWRIYRGAGPSAINLAVTSHIFYAFLRARSDGSLYYLDEKADLELDVNGAKGCIQACVGLRSQKPDLKVLVSVGGGSGSQCFPQIASKAESRERFALSLQRFTQEYGFDGVDVDWEHPANADEGHNFLLLLQVLRKHLPFPKLLTTALPAGEWCLRNIDLARTAMAIDFFNLMCYDFAGPWTELSGHQAQLFASRSPHNAFAKRSGDSAVRYMMSKGVPAFKIVIGIPVYGRSFAGADTIGQKFTESAEFEYKDIPRSGEQEFIDNEAVAAGCVSDTDGFITYDVPATVVRKAQYVKQFCLGGLFYWTGVADAVGPRSLMSAGYDALMC